jgi:hypothetical protein
VAHAHTSPGLRSRSAGCESAGRRVVLWLPWCQQWTVAHNESILAKYFRLFFKEAEYILGRCRNRCMTSYARFEVLIAVVMKSSIIGDITPCSPLKIKPTIRRNMTPPSSELTIRTCFMLVSWWLIHWSWRRRRHAPPKRRLTFNRLHAVLSYKNSSYELLRTLLRGPREN